ncbi:MAG TPA: hypothetical protein VGD40_04155 [Chryseosolibacter sp.]
MKRLRKLGDKLFTPLSIEAMGEIRGGDMPEKTFEVSGSMSSTRVDGCDDLRNTTFFDGVFAFSCTTYNCCLE